MEFAMGLERRLLVIMKFTPPQKCCRSLYENSTTAFLEVFVLFLSVTHMDVINTVLVYNLKRWENK